MFDLERAIAEWKKSLRRKPSLQDGDRIELESYLRDKIEDLTGRGVGEEEAFRIAEATFARAVELDGDYYRARANGPRRSPLGTLFRIEPGLLWNFIRVARRRIRLHKGTAVIKVSGLAVGLACFILFFMSWSYERGFDRSIPQASRIFRVDTNAGETSEPLRGIPPALTDLLVQKVPEIEETTRFAEVGIGQLRYGEKRVQQHLNFKYADSSLFRLFSLPFIRGNAGTALDDPDSIVLCESTAQKLFGRDDPIGKVLQVAFYEFDGPDRTLDFMVRGILKEQPSASSYRFEGLISFRIKNRLDAKTLPAWSFSEKRAITFVRAIHGVPTKALENKIKSLALSGAASSSKSEPDSIFKNLILTPLAGLHLRDADLGKYLEIFGAISLAVLLLAGINFVNLSTASAATLTKEVGIRKIVGAGRKPLILQFLCESAILALLALALALLLVEFARPMFQASVGREIAISELWGPRFIAILLGIAGTVGLLAGAYPAFLLSAIRPFSLFALGRTVKTSRSGLWKGLVFAQFALVGILVIGTLAIDRQMRFIDRANRGMDLKNIFLINMYDASAYSDKQARVERFKRELRANSAIVGVSNPWGVPPVIDNERDVYPEGPNSKGPLKWRWMEADANFLRTFSIPLVAGRDFQSDSSADVREAILINESAAKILGPGFVVGRRLSVISVYTKKPDDFTIVGVVKDFHGRTLHSPIEPLIIKCNRGCWGVLSVKIGGSDRRAAIAAIERAWKAVFPDTPIIMHDVHEWGRLFYGSEIEMFRLGRIFSVLAILLACFGLFGLVSQSLKQRRKELGIRKVLGAPYPRMIWVFFREFAKPVVLSNLVAWPVAYGLAGEWLRGFVFRATVPGWLFLAGSGLILVIAGATVGGHVYAAARENPVKSLRYE